MVLIHTEIAENRLSTCATPSDRLGYIHAAVVPNGRVSLLHNSFINNLTVQGVAEKSGPLNFFAVFSATVWDFNTKFYSFIY